jgi:hypothetical protein
MLISFLERIPGTVIVIVLCLCALWSRGNVSLCRRASPALNQQAWTDHLTNRRPAGVGRL